MMAAAIRIGAIARKEFKHLLRDPRLLLLALVMPLMQLLLFAYAISFDVKNVPTVLLDQDKTPSSREYVQSYLSSDFFRVLGEVESLGAIDAEFERNRAIVAVIVPSGFERALALGEKAQVAVLLDGSAPDSAQIARAYTIALNQRYGQKLAFAEVDRQGLDLSAVGQLEPKVRVWYNPERKSSDFLIPGLMVVIIMIVTVQQTAVTLVRERDQGTQEQMAVSPLRRGELMIGKLLPWTLLAFADMVAITLVGMLVFGIPLRGSLGFLALSAVVFVAAALGMGLVISALTPSLETANIAALLAAFLPAFLLSGFAFPLESAPTALDAFSYIFPARYMMVIARGVFLKGAGFAELWPQLVYLGIFVVVVTAAASKLYGRRWK